MIIPIILALGFLIGSTAMPNDPSYEYDLTTKELYELQEKRTRRMDW